MFRRFVTRCTSVYVLSIHTLCSHSLNEYTTVLEVWDFPFLLPQPTTSILFSTPSPISGDESSRVGSYPTPLTPHTGGARDVGSNRAACQTAPALDGTARPPRPNHPSHRDHQWRFSSPPDRQVYHHKPPTRALTPLMLVSSCSPRPHHPSLALCFIHHLLSSTLQHSCSCSNPRHQSPSLICSSSTPVAVEAPTPKHPSSTK